MEYKQITKGRYNLNNDLMFDSENGDLKINSTSALEIAYTLFDCYGFNYDILEELEEKINA
jgi:hypothetical protein